jgi:hypothetical protein
VTQRVTNRDVESHALVGRGSQRGSDRIEREDRGSKGDKLISTDTNRDSNSDPQTEKLLIIAATHAAQAALIIEQARREVPVSTDTVYLGKLAKRLRSLVCTVQGIARKGSFFAGNR